jgi:hypothetical protein
LGRRRRIHRATRFFATRNDGFLDLVVRENLPQFDTVRFARAKYQVASGIPGH